ncbi:hypothetical protein D1AOALGA4SA_7992, partial [Olavius algarvensis Delta 1 endosymbiont]
DRGGMLAAGQQMAPVIVLNEIYQNGGHGVYCWATSPAQVLFNNIHHNLNYDVYNYSYNSLSIDARYNHWGDETTAIMVSGQLFNIPKIYDIFDNSNKGRVDYSHWIESSIDTSATLVSKIFDPDQEEAYNTNRIVVSGIAHAKEGVAKVEVSLEDDGVWLPVSFEPNFTGKTLWHVSFDSLEQGEHSIVSRVTDRNGDIEAAGDQTIFSIGYDYVTKSGVLDANETWSDNIQLDGDLTVPENITLTILPGTTVTIPSLLDSTRGGQDGSRIELVVEGTLIAAGTPDQPVTITSSRGERADWVGILVNGSIYLKNTIVEYGTYGLRCAGQKDSNEIIIEDSVIRHTGGDGIHVSAGSNVDIAPIIHQNTIMDNEGNGIYLGAGSGTTKLKADISDNTVVGNGSAGIFTEAHASSGEPAMLGRISGNTVANHPLYGIYTYTHDAASSTLTIEFNGISASGTGIYSYFSEAADTSTLEIIGNKIHSGDIGLEIYSDYSSISPQIRFNEIHNNTSEGIVCWYGNSANHILAPYFEGNEIRDNGDRGVYLKATEEVIFTSNGLYGNFSYDLYNDSSHDIQAAGNWWGETTSNEMNSEAYPAEIYSIFDKLDDQSKGFVHYADWLSSYDFPDPPTLNPITSPTRETSQTIAGAKEAGAAIFLNGVEVYPMDDQTTWSYVMTLKEGKNFIYLYAKSSTGANSTVVKASVIRDTTAPVLQSSRPANGAHLKRAVEKISITLIDTDSKVDLPATIQGASVETQAGQDVPGEWDYNETQASFMPEQALQNDIYTVTIHPTDRPLGNQSQSIITFTVDLVDPAVPTLNPLTSPTDTTTQTISGQKETGSSVWLGNRQIYALDSSSSWSYDLTLVEGSNDFRLHARDRAGNKSPERSFSIVLDQTPPVLSSTEPAAGAFVAEDISRIVFNFSDATTLAAPETLATVVLKTASGETIPITAHIQEPGAVILVPAESLAEDTYIASVQAYDALGNTVAATFSFTVDQTPPAPPTLDPVPAQTGLMQLTLAGTKEADTSIWINGMQAIAINDATTWSHEITLSEGINHFEIYCKDAAGHQSDAVSGETEYDETAPLPVANLAADGQGIGTVVHLDWTGYSDLAAAQGDVQYYRVFVSDRLFTQTAGLEPAATLSAGTYSHTIAKLQRNQKYYFAVLAIDSKNNVNSSVTPVSTVTVDNIPPAEVTGLAVEGLADRLRFTWFPAIDAYSDLAGYRIYIDGSPTPLPLAPAETSYELTGLELSSSRHLKITTYDSDNNESNGSQITGYTLLANPVISSANSQVGRIKLYWEPSQPSENVKHYNVYYSAADFSSVDVKAPTITTTSTSATVTGLTNEVTYYFAVTAVNFLNGEYKEVDAVSAAPVNGTMVSGNITSNTTWTMAGSPYIVTGDITVRHSSYANSDSYSATLTIEPGVEVRFEKGTGLYMGKPHSSYSWLAYWGALSVQGTVDNPVVFTSNATAPGLADWKGIYFRKWTGGSQSLLQHCVIEYGGHTHNANLYMDQASVPIRDSVIRHSGGHGAYLSSSGAAVT